MYNKGSFNNQQGWRGAAFTLVELLVVIGIIALLISILLPSLNKARASAQAVTCQSNLRQVYLATYFYAESNRGYVPPPHTAKVVGGTWFRAVSGIIPAAPVPRADRRIYTCPSFDLTYANYGESNYTMNGYIHVIVTGLWSEPMKLNRATGPAEIPFYIDGQPAPGASIGSAWYGIVSPTQWIGPPTGHIGYHHNRRANIVFFDGHTGNVEEFQAPALKWW